jgi:hypothetical protein
MRNFIKLSFKITTSVMMMTIFFSSTLKNAEAGVCSPDIIKTKQDKDQALAKQKELENYYADNGRCAPGTEVKYISTLSEGNDGKPIPCFAFKYLDGDQKDKVVPEMCDPVTDKCVSMLREGESFDVKLLQAQSVAGPEEEGSINKFFNRYIHPAIQVGQKLLQYTAISFPVGDGVNAFVSDMDSHQMDAKNDHEKEVTAAKQTREIIQHMLGSFPSAVNPGFTTACENFNHAPYVMGTGVASLMSEYFNKLAQEKGTNLGCADEQVLDKSAQELLKLRNLLGRMRRSNEDKPIQLENAQVTTLITQ